MRSLLLASSLFFVLMPFVSGQSQSSWRAATPAELQNALPARAPVEKERIETEMRTASGITDSHGKMIAGVVLITAGYSADGKYSHYLLVQAPITFGDVTLPTGNYVIGWQRSEDTLIVKFYDAANGEQRGSTTAHHLANGTRVESFRIWPPANNPILQIGRFAVPYIIEKQPSR